MYPTTPLPSLSLIESVIHNTIITNMLTGLEQRRSRWAFPKLSVKLNYKILTASEIDTLWNFYREQNGSLGEFTFLFPDSNTRTGIFVDQGDSSTRLFNLPVTNGVEANITAYVDASEGTNSTWGYINNGGFETGDYTGWTANDATVTTDDKQDGTHSSKLVGDTNVLDGAQSDPMVINDTDYKYIVDQYIKITDGGGTFAGTVNLLVYFFTDEAGTVAHGTPSSVLDTYSATTGWDNSNKSVAPAALSPDINIPSGTKSIRIGSEWTGVTDGDVFIDSVKVTIDSRDKDYLMLHGGGVDGKDRVYFQPDATPTVSQNITCDFEGQLTLNMRFSSDNLTKDRFQFNLFRTGLTLLEVKQ